MGKEERIQIGREFVRIGKRYGIAIRSCCEGMELASCGVDVSGCMTKQVIERAIGYSLEITEKRKPVREGCNCLLGNDIGMYNTYGHGCLYCYANCDATVVRENRKRHDPTSPLLIGNLNPRDHIMEVEQKSYLNGQIILNFY